MITDLPAINLGGLRPYTCKRCGEPGWCNVKHRMRVHCLECAPIVQREQSRETHRELRRVRRREEREAAKYIPYFEESEPAPTEPQEQAAVLKERIRLALAAKHAPGHYLGWRDGGTYCSVPECSLNQQREALRASWLKGDSR